MKKRLTLWLITLLVLLVLILDFPKTRVKFNLGPVKIDTVLVHPTINLQKIGLPVKRDLEPKLGLDLAGGAHLVLGLDMSKIGAGDRQDAADASKEIIEKRVNLFGVTEPVVQAAKVGNEFQVIVELPGVTDVSAALSLIGRTAQLEFKELTGATPSAMPGAAPSDFVPTGLTGASLQKAQVTFSSQTGLPQVSLQFNSEGAAKFEEITARNVARPLAIFLDEEVISAPTVQETISGGQAVITGQFTTQEAKQLAIQLNAGALPVPVKIAAQQSIGPTLGAESVKKGMTAALVGFGAVSVFMLLNYGLAGFVAILALLLYTGIVLALFKLIPVTLTLAGIAGFILSIGMAVDANILIFERYHEEIRWGNSKFAAIEAGFTRAWSSIRDSNISSLITAFILYWFGTGLVRGFALTLAIGILVSMFSAIFVTKTLMTRLLKPEPRPTS